MNIIDLGAIDRLVKRNTNLLTAFKVIDEIESEKVVDNIHKNIVQFDICDVVVQNDVIDLISAGGNNSDFILFCRQVSERRFEKNTG